MDWPRATEILAHHHMYDAFPDDPADYYKRRGTWVGDRCDTLALGGTISDDNVAFGLVPREMPLGKGNVEVWMDYVRHFSDLISSPKWRGIFYRCLDVQREVRNETERYVGHYDQRWKLRQQAYSLLNDEALIDLKTGSCGPVTGLQLALYDMALGGPRRRRYGVLLGADAPAKLIPFTDSRDYDRARILARAWWVAKEYLP